MRGSCGGWRELSFPALAPEKRRDPEGTPTGHGEVGCLYLRFLGSSRSQAWPLGPPETMKIGRFFRWPQGCVFALSQEQPQSHMARCATQEDEKATADPSTSLRCGRDDSAQSGGCDLFSGQILPLPSVGRDDIAFFGVGTGPETGRAAGRGSWPPTRRDCSIGIRLWAEAGQLGVARPGAG